MRGVAGVHPLDAETVARLGWAAAQVLAGDRRDPSIRLLVGRDTRESGPWLEETLARGVSAAGATIVSAGILPTPAVASLIGANGFDGGFVISASHNPYQDNGIKLFLATGQKADDRVEGAIERLMSDATQARPASGRAPIAHDYAESYIEHILPVLPDPARLAGLRIALDCANGATYRVAPEVFRRLGLDVTPVQASPDGQNINRGCGSTAPAHLVNIVREGGFDLGVSFDGDGDRAILVDHRGVIVNGDGLLLACARHMKAAGRLPGNAVVATVMSNLGLELSLRKAGIDLVRCPVGDRFVTETMKERGLALGGEQSGHLVFADHRFTGDGLVTALRVLEVLADRGCTLATVADELEVSPQVLVNVPVRVKRNLEEIEPVQAILTRIERALADRGRLVVRYSGTEPLLRVMLEGPDESLITAWANEIAQAVREHLG